ncbi:M28 family peptidase [Aquimarina sp. 2201CG14-23]|uniref:M28 family peptidase n=1 Tax=Aquimarina mycalae TaxID=3040073 RepID=UPI002478268E|nr:M28 family peptidase [Aquimarina sp. 2201CG14-23]MDH7448177.1 M28 family peptidase [Aquimarina sp. 2201CG14-23]
MKKIVIILIVIILAVFGAIMFFPSLLFSSAIGQKIMLTLEGDQVAKFYFKENQKSKDTIYMTGVIYSNTLKDIKEVLSANPSLTTIVMEEVPGSIDDDINLLASLEIKKQGINTYIPKHGMVASGGTDMFLAGTKRNAHHSAKLGVHSWAGEDAVALDFPRDHEEHDKYLNYYKEINIPEEFYWYTLEAAPANDIHWMTAEEINTYQVFTSSQKNIELLDIQKKLASDDFKGRGTGANNETQELIKTYFSDIGLHKFRENYSTPFVFNNERTKKEGRGTNIMGYIPGKVHKNKYIVIGAHYDHLGIINNEIYNGADDNASGTAALLCLAKYYAKNQPDYSIIFVAFDAEEQGLFGSKHFVNNPPIPIEEIKLNINFDMISRNDKNEIYVVGTFPYPQFKPIIEKIAATSDLKVSYGHDDPEDSTKDYWMYSSDNGSFFEKGIPNITFSEEDHADYHKATDDFENINPEFYIKVYDLIQKSITKIDQNFPVSSK